MYIKKETGTYLTTSALFGPRKLYTSICAFQIRVIVIFVI